MYRRVIRDASRGRNTARWARYAAAAFASPFAPGERSKRPLDGNWSQAKALWWRNAWMLKCRRVILGPRQPSRYGRLRREPRRDSLSTIEAAAMLVSRLENRPEIEATLTASFEKMQRGSVISNQ